MQEQERMNSLDMINERFIQLQREKVPGAVKKRPFFRRKMVLLLLFLLLLLVAVVLGLWYFVPRWRDQNSFAGAAGSARRASITGNYQGILTAQEVEEWNTTRVQKGKVYLKLKTEIQVTGRRQAFIRVVNPPYCEYDYRFTIAVKETGEILYESETLSPGTVLEQASLNREIDHGQTEAVVTYTFYRHGEEESVGTREVQVVLDTEK